MTIHLIILGLAFCVSFLLREFAIYMNNEAKLGVLKIKADAKLSRHMILSNQPY